MTLPRYMWPLASVVAASALPAVEDEAAFLRGVGEFGIRGLLQPFRRDEINDFASGDGTALINAKIGQVMGTECSSPTDEGELPWRPEFGSLLDRLRHRTIDDVAEELAIAYTQDALSRWMPSIRVTGAQLSREKDDRGQETILTIMISWKLVTGREEMGSGSAKVRLPTVAQ